MSELKDNSKLNLIESAGGGFYRQALAPVNFHTQLKETNINVPPRAAGCRG